MLGHKKKNARKPARMPRKKLDEKQKRSVLKKRLLQRPQPKTVRMKEIEMMKIHVTNYSK